MKYREEGCSKICCNKFPPQHLNFQKQILKQTNKLLCLRNGKRGKVGKNVASYVSYGFLVFFST